MNLTSKILAIFSAALLAAVTLIAMQAPTPSDAACQGTNYSGPVRTIDYGDAQPSDHAQDILLDSCSISTFVQKVETQESIENIAKFIVGIIPGFGIVGQINSALDLLTVPASEQIKNCAIANNGKGISFTISSVGGGQISNCVAQIDSPPDDCLPGQPCPNSIDSPATNTLPATNKIEHSIRR